MLPKCGFYRHLAVPFRNPLNLGNPLSVDCAPQQRDAAAENLIQ